MAGDSYALTMRAKLINAFRFGFTGTPIDRTMQNTHRDFGPIKDGEQERYLSYYGIRRAIKDGATLEVHYIRDKVPFEVDEPALSVGFEQMCEEMEVEDEEAKDVVQRQKSQWKELARDPRRVEIVIDKMLAHFLEYPDPDGFKAQLVGVDRKACVLYKEKLDEKKPDCKPPFCVERCVRSKACSRRARSIPANSRICAASFKVRQPPALSGGGK